MQLKTNIIGLFLISVFIGCGVLDTTETNNNVTKLYVTLQQQDKVAIYDTPDLELLKTIDINFTGSNIKDTPHFIVIDEENGYWFVTTVESDYVAQYSLKTDELLDTVYVGDYPALMAVNPDNKRLYVSRMMMKAQTYQINEIDYGGTELVNLVSFDLVSPIPHGIAIDQAKEHIFTISNTADWIYRITLNSGDIFDVTMDASNSITSTNEVKLLQPIQCISLNDSLLAISCSAPKDEVNGQVQIWNGNNLTIKSKYEFGSDSKPWHLIKSPLREEMFIVLGGSDGAGGVACLTYTANEIKLKWQYLSGDFTGLHGITIDAAGEYLYVSGRDTHYLYQFDAEYGSLLASIPLDAENQIVSPGGISMMQNLCTDCE